MEHKNLNIEETANSDLGAVSRCAFLVYVEDTGKLIVIAKDKEEVTKKMKLEGFTKPFKIMTALSFIA